MARSTSPRRPRSRASPSPAAGAERIAEWVAAAGDLAVFGGNAGIYMLDTLDHMRAPTTGLTELGRALVEREFDALGLAGPRRFVTGGAPGRVARPRAVA
jgi:hypothetical protein